jgi:hypothetical protein
MPRRRIALVCAIVAVLLGLGGWLMLRDGATHGATAAAQVHASAAADLRAPPAAGPDRAARSERVDVPRVGSVAAPTHTSSGLESLARRPPEAASADPARPRETPGSGPAGPPVNSEDAYPEGDLTDRIGGHEALVAALNHDFMPLVSECVDQARVRRPELTGLLVLGVEPVADPEGEHAGVIESVDVRPGNEVDDPALWECVRESALSMDLPAPADGGGEPFELSLRIDDDDDDDDE